MCGVVEAGFLPLAACGLTVLVRLALYWKERFPFSPQLSHGAAMSFRKISLSHRIEPGGVLPRKGRASAQKKSHASRIEPG